MRIVFRNFFRAEGTNPWLVVLCLLAASLAEGAGLVLALVAWRWSALLTATLNPDLARAAGIDPKREQLVLTLALAVVVAVAIKVVGVLLITAMLIIPSATARPFARTPEAMAAIASVIAMVSAWGGLRASYLLDTPTGPTIVCVVAILFCLSTLASGARRQA